MLPTIGSDTSQPTPLSPMTLSDRLITLAKDADTAGYTVTAEQLVHLAMTVFDEAPRRPPRTC
jgi:hypothetical protein